VVDSSGSHQVLVEQHGIDSMESFFFHAATIICDDMVEVCETTKWLSKICSSMLSVLFSGKLVAMFCLGQIFLRVPDF
jgi:hypothetical protein